jgi:hypothetical protein
MFASSRLTRVRAAALHLGLSLLIGLAVALIVLRLWFPVPFDEVSGGRELFFLVVSVDVVLGPLLTLAVFDPRKAVKWLRLDLAVIGVLQIAALAYGIHTCFIARPVALVFEKDRFRVVAAHEVREQDLPAALPAYRRLSWTGPVTVATRPATDDERFDAITLATEGFDVGQRPAFWVPYESQLRDVLKEGRTLAAVVRQCPDQREALDALVRSQGASPDTVKVLPMMARQLDWAIALDEKGAMLGFVPCDVFAVPRPDRVAP